MFVVARAAGLQSGFKLVALGNGAGQQNVVLGRAGNTAGLQYFTTRVDGAYGWFNTGGGLVTGEALLLGVVQGAGSVGSSVSASVSVNGGRWRAVVMCSCRRWCHGRRTTSGRAIGMRVGSRVRVSPRCWCMTGR